MTIILSPEKIQSEKKAGDEERSRSRNALAREEARLVKSVNDLKEEERIRRRNIDEDLALHEEYVAEKKRVLLAEVTSLEERRADALKPIKALRKEADDRNARSLEREKVVGEREEVLKESEQRNVEEIERLEDERQELDEREETAEERERLVADSEERTRESARNLGNRWTEFHTAVNAKNVELVAREVACAASEKANTDRAIQLDARETAQNEKDRELKDRSATLERAAAEIFSKKTDNQN